MRTITGLLERYDAQPQLRKRGKTCPSRESGDSVDVRVSNRGKTGRVSAVIHGGFFSGSKLGQRPKIRFRSREGFCLVSLGRVSCILASVAATASIVLSQTCYADNRSSERSAAERELAPFFNKSISITGSLVETATPQTFAELFGTQLNGCPASPVAPVEESVSLSFATFRPGPWAGALDGINTRIEKPTGDVGGGVAVPTGSTARLPGSSSGPELEFTFDPSLNISRALVDAAAEEFDRCFSKLPQGTYTSDDFIRLCPPRAVSRAEQNQTCVAFTNGVVGAELQDGSGYEANFYVATMCDFIGYGRSGDRNTGFTNCYYQRYRGVATIGEPSSELRARNARLRAVTKGAQRKCASGKGKGRVRAARIQACVARHMSAAMANAR